MTKNNKALRAALVLCVLALFCAAFVGATFAKYVTADDAMDTARVAKWGVSVSVGGKLFGTDYAANGAASSDTIINATLSESVAAGDGLADIVAPGTKADKGIIIELAGKPEVQYKVSAENKNTIQDIYLGKGTWAVMVPAPGVTEDNFDIYFEGEADEATKELYKLDGSSYVVANTWEADTDYFELHDKVTLGADYYPLVWTVDNAGEDTVTVAKTANATGLVDINTRLLAAINDNAVDGVANNTLAVKYTLKWAWAFEGQNDGADTILGNLIDDYNALDAESIVVMLNDSTGNYDVAADDKNCNLQVSYDIAVTVEQVD